MDQWNDSGYLSANYSLETGQVYTLASLLEKQRQMLAIIQARGQLNLIELAKTLRVPSFYIRQWLSSLSRMDKFSGYVNWQTNQIISQQLTSLARNPNCPNCGGLLTLAGQGINQCAYCGSEIFLSKPFTFTDENVPNNSLNNQANFDKVEITSNQPFKNQILKWVKLFRPTRTPRLLSIALFIFLAIGLICSFSIYTSETTSNNVTLALVAFGVFDLPVICLIFILLAIFENKSPPRFVLWGSAMITLGISLIIVILAMWLDSSADRDIWFTTLIYIAAPVLSIFSIPVVYFGIKAWPEIAEALNTDLNSNAILLVNQHGEMTYKELANKLNISINQVDDLLDGLLKSRQLAGTINSRLQRIYTAAALAEKHASLLILVRDHGKIALDDLAVRLNAPNELLQSWIYQLVQMGRFKGYINWNEGYLYASQASKLADQTNCPACGGSLKPGPNDAICCEHCGCEILH